MRNAAAVIAIMIAGTLLAQPSPRRPPRATPFADSAESAIKQANEQLTALKKLCERDIAVLQHVRLADAALADPMQPFNSVQKAKDEMVTARKLEESTPGVMPDFLVVQGITKVQHELDSAGMSPATADFGRLRSVLRTEALGPASRSAIRDTSSLQDELLAWLRVQQLIGDYVKTLSEISGQTLRASEQ